MTLAEAMLCLQKNNCSNQHLSEDLYLTAKEIAHYVEQTWQVAYSESGMT